MREPPYRAVFLRLETDVEFRRRLAAAGFLTWCGDKELDDLAWNHRQMQRRIVEDVA